MTVSWVADTYRPGDETAINGLFERVFGTRRSVEEWRWKFREGPSADRSVIRLARAGERIVGQYAVVFTRFLCAGKQVHFAQVVDNMIHPEWRGGLGRSRMQRTLFERAEEDGMGLAAVGFGFPGLAHYRIGRRLLGYEDLARVNVRLRSLTWARHLRRMPGAGRAARTVGRVHARIHGAWLRSRARGLLAVKVRRVRDFDERFDRFWERVSTSFGVMAVRDRTYLRWRYGTRPGASYTTLVLERGETLAGYAVLAVRDDGVRCGLVADLLSLPETGLAERLVHSALEFFLEEGCDLAACWSLPGSAYDPLLSRYFPRKAPEPTRAVIRIYEQTVDPRIVRDPSRWHLTMGDSDSV